MKKITLLKNHELAGVLHLEGAVIEVDDETHKYIMQSYATERAELIEIIKQEKSELDAKIELMKKRPK